MSTPIMRGGYAEIRLEHDNGSRIADVTEIVTSVNWSGDVNEAYRALEVTLKNTLDMRERRIDFENGDRIRFYNHDEELFRGRIFKFGINHTGDETLTVYDTNTYLTRSQITRTFRNVTASDIFTRVAREYGVTPGEVADTGYRIPKLVANGDTLFQLFVKALTLTEKQNGRRFRIINRQGRVHLEERKAQVTRQVLESGANILSASYSQSIEDLRNRLVMVGGDKDQFREVRINQQLIDKYGLMAAVESYSGNEVKRAEVKQAADQKFRELATINDEANVTCLGINSVTSGSAVYVVERMTGILGGYYVSSDQHTFTNGKHEMRLTLSATDDLPRIEVKPEKEPKKPKKKKEER
ncbi:hypothetical protein FLK61_35360 [Paenalkalicoccus suaedae]|uniref:YqbQ/XkdQ domain-containing protein n=1 Tax=Paenalkalicoccus suaedae TaxID=2592382 RepID=A0A859FGK9_9BACI|nr:hypothetical protein [Paenalkalicoccus suaedae]QKS71948.1 hypothetical protein FLK61_35360 [Paenalkalicoccus suaedae]